MMPAPQSTFEPATRAAALVNELGLWLYVVLGLVFVVVLLVALLALFARPRPAGSGAWIVSGGIALPLALLVPLFVASLLVTREPGPAPGAALLRVELTGLQWWWRVRYFAQADDPTELANELHLPLGEPVELVLGTEDVIHSFWVPALGGKVDMIPGRAHRVVVTATRPGVFRGQCAEYCGTQHALMSLVVVVEAPAAFRDWLARQGQPAAEPAAPHLARGRELFFRAGCDECHAVRGTHATGDRGPDLTHVGSRRTLGAATLGNGPGALAGWVAGNQALKPGNHMPGDNPFAGDQLRALAAWLASLE